jgi:hypothetical protein
MDRATRYGSCIPVTTIGIAPIRTRDQRATGDEFADSPANAAGNVIGASLRPMLADVPRMSWFANIKMLLWGFVDKMDGE